MNQEDITFKRRYILQSLATIDLEFTYNITYDSDNNVTAFVWMTSYMRENFERCDNNLSIDLENTSL